MLHEDYIILLNIHQDYGQISSSVYEHGYDLEYIFGFS